MLSWWALPVAAILLVAAMLILAPHPHAQAAIPGYDSCQFDDGGANDYPGQRDLTQMCQSLQVSGAKPVAWSWDELGTSGNNTMDACALFDTDDDGKANFAVCAITIGSPATYSDTVTYSCSDTRSDRCAGQQLAGGQASDCSNVSQTATDPFPAGAGYPQDTTAQCSVQLSDVGGTGTAVLINVCAYPSSQPNSAPSDCVLAPDVPHLTLVKDVDDPDGIGLLVSQFTLTATKGATSISGKTGDAAITSAIVTTGTWVLTESADAGTPAFQLVDWDCDGATASENEGTWSVTLGAGQNVTCTATNEAVAVASSISTAPLVYPNDSATVSAASGGNVQGSVTFSLYDTLANCESGGTTGRLFTQTRNLPGDATSSTVSTTNYPGGVGTPYAISAAGPTTLYWLVAFDSTNAAQEGRESLCVEQTTVTIVGDAGPGTAPATD